MGRGLYRMLGWGILNPPAFNWDDDDPPYLFDLVETSYETTPEYLMLPIAIDDGFLQVHRSLSSLDNLGFKLPHVTARHAVTVPRLTWWPDVGVKEGAWVSSWFVDMWELIRRTAATKGLDLPEGSPILVSDWD